MSSHSFAATCPTFSFRTIRTLSIAPPNSASSFPSPVTPTADRFRSKFSITALVPPALSPITLPAFTSVRFFRQLPLIVLLRTLPPPRRPVRCSLTLTCLPLPTATNCRRPLFLILFTHQGSTARSPGSESKFLSRDRRLCHHQKKLNSASTAEAWLLGLASARSYFPLFC